MGLNCVLQLPPQTRAKDIHDAILALAGNVPTKYPFGRSNRGPGRDFFWGWDTKYHAEPGSTYPDYLFLQGPAPVRGKEQTFYAMFCFEDENKAGWRTLYPRSNGFWVAVCLRLIHLFGGILDISDGDSTEQDVIVPFEYSEMGLIEASGLNSHNEGFHMRQDACFLQAPLTQEELAEGTRLSAYKAL